MRHLVEAVHAWFLPETGTELQERLFRSLCLLGAAMAFVIIPVNALQRLPVVINVGLAWFGTLATALYFAARRGRYFTRTLFVALLVLLCAAWFPNDGSEGSIAYYFFPALMYPLVFFRGRARLVSLAVVGVNYVLLLGIERAHPELLTRFVTVDARALDLLTGFMASGVTAMALLWIVLNGYHDEREQLRMAARALSDSQEKLSRVFAVSPDALYIIDPETRRFIEVNERFERFIGFTRAEVIGRTGVEIGVWINPGDRSELYRRLESDGVLQGFVSQFRRRDGSVFWGSTSAGWIDVGGRPCVMFSTRDVNEQIEAQHEASESRTLLASLIDSTDDFVFLVDPETFALKTFNAAFGHAMARTLGVDVRPGIRLEDALPPQPAEEWRGFYRRALERGPFSVEYTVPATGQIVLHSFNIVRHDGHVIGVSVFGKDITERKRDEAEREQMKHQLLESHKMESLGSLAGGVAHDFNNMLGGIMGHADLLYAEERDPERRAHLDAIMSAAKRSGELTRKLLAFGRRGKNIVEGVDLNGVVRDTLEMMRPSLSPATRIVTELQAAWTVDGDPSQLHQLVLNLCVNASEAMPDGGVLAVRTRDVAAFTTGDAPAEPGVELVIADTGVGMSDQVKARAFEPFFTTKAGGSGTGLGLATVYGIAKLHHGTVDLASAPGSGTTFIVQFPKGALALEPAAVPVVEADGRGRILVVEDEDLLRSFATAALERLGYKTVTAVDGVEGVRVFRECHADLIAVLLDLKMPRMGGREAFLEMRGINPGVPVLICSGYGDNEEVQGLISVGARGLLPKPYRLADLSEQLARIGTARV